MHRISEQFWVILDIPYLKIYLKWHGYNCVLIVQLHCQMHSLPNFIKKNISSFKISILEKFELPRLYTNT